MSAATKTVMALALVLTGCADGSLSSSAWPQPITEYAIEQWGCLHCHGAGMPPAWATDATRVESLRLERGIRGADHTLELHRDSSSTRAWNALPATVGAELLGFVARDDVSQSARMDPGDFDQLAEEVLSDGLFRFADEATTNFSTHLETAFIFVRWEDGTETILGTMTVRYDEDHPSLFKAFDALDRAEARLEWD